MPHAKQHADAQKEAGEGDGDKALDRPEGLQPADDAGAGKAQEEHQHHIVAGEVLVGMRSRRSAVCHGERTRRLDNWDHCARLCVCAVCPAQGVNQRSKTLNFERDKN